MRWRGASQGPPAIRQNAGLIADKILSGEEETDDDDAATAEALRTHADGRVWLHTGDIGTMDADGFFSFTSRLKRMIKSSGFNVYPAQVEAVLCEHPAVAKHRIV